MLRFQWNRLRVGDRVWVHDDRVPSAPLVEAFVAVVDTECATDSNVLGVRIPGMAGLIHPRRAAVHFIEYGPRDTCWRCESLATARSILDSVAA